MVVTADNNIDRRGDLPRTIPEAMTELRQLLGSETVIPADVERIVTELEADYASVYESFGVAIQHEADAANTMGNIRRLLSDPRLEQLGVYSKLAIHEKR